MAQSLTHRPASPHLRRELRLPARRRGLDVSHKAIAVTDMESRATNMNVLLVIDVFMPFHQPF